MLLVHRKLQASRFVQMIAPPWELMSPYKQTPDRQTNRYETTCMPCCRSCIQSVVFCMLAVSSKAHLTGRALCWHRVLQLLPRQTWAAKLERQQMCRLWQGAVQSGAATAPAQLPGKFLTPLHTRACDISQTWLSCALNRVQQASYPVSAYHDADC